MIKTFRFKRKTYIPALLCALLLTACSQNNNPEQQNETKSSQIEDSSSASDKNSASDSNKQTIESISLIDDEHPITELSESTLDLSTYGLDYEYTTDAQPEYQWTSVARGDSGYYLWQTKDLHRIMYFDIASNSYIPLCNKPNCSHSNKECHAVFSKLNMQTNIQYELSYIQYYDGCVYIIGHDIDGNVYLYQITFDGSTCKKYMTLYKSDLSTTEGAGVTEFTAPDVCIHRGYVYFINPSENPSKLRRTKLGESNAEVVFENAGNRPLLYRMKAYGDYLFFQSGNDIKSNHYQDAGIFALNVNTTEVHLIKKGAVADYTISDAFLYYSTTSGINRYSLKDMSDKSIIDNGLNEMLEVHDGKIYCFYDDTQTLSQYNSEGRLLNKITDKHLIMCYMGDSEYLFAWGTDGTKIISVDELSKGNAKWKILK